MSFLLLFYMEALNCFLESGLKHCCQDFNSFFSFGHELSQVLCLNLSYHDPGWWILLSFPLLPQPLSFYRLVFQVTWFSLIFFLFIPCTWYSYIQSTGGVECQLVGDRRHAFCYSDAQWNILPVEMVWNLLAFYKFLKNWISTWIQGTKCVQVIFFIIMLLIMVK